MHRIIATTNDPGAGSGLVARYDSAGITLYLRSANAIRSLGTFASASRAWEAVDVVDAAVSAPVVRLHDTSRVAGQPVAGYDSLAA